MNDKELTGEEWASLNPCREVMNECETLKEENSKLRVVMVLVLDELMHDEADRMPTADIIKVLREALSEALKAPASGP